MAPTPRTKSVTVSCPTLGPPDAAEFLGLKEQTLASWRCLYPDRLPFIRIGTRRIRYRISDLEKYLADQTVGAVLTSKK